MATKLDSAFEEAKQDLEAGRKSFKDRLARQQADDRSLIAKVIIGAFVVLVGWLVIVVSVGAYLFDWATISEPAKFLMTILSSVLLPVVTLVLGYYFANK